MGAHRRRSPPSSATPKARSACCATTSAATPSLRSSSPPCAGPQSQPKKSAARATIELLRKRNHSVYEIAQALKEQGTPLSATAVGEVLRDLGFAALPRRLDEERPGLPRPTVESVADARTFDLAPRRFVTRCGGLFLFLPDLVRLGLEPMADTARLPGSKRIPRAHALRACLALQALGHQAQEPRDGARRRRGSPTRPVGVQRARRGQSPRSTTPTTGSTGKPIPTAAG